MTMPSRYTFAEYSPDWSFQFQKEAEFLASVFGPDLAGVHHIGSTSVPGLAAKPIIDMLPLVWDIRQVERHTSTLGQAGYRSWGEYGLPGRRFFTKDRGEFRTHNVHIYAVDDPDAERHLAFCAYLRAHPAARDDYAQLKRQVYAQHPDDIGAYNDGKNDWIKRTEALATPWYRAWHAT